MATPLEIARRGILRFAMEPDELICHLEELNRMPLYDTWHWFDISDGYVQTNRDLFSEQQLQAFGKFKEIVDSLSDEPGDFWADEAVYGEDWRYVREQAKIALQALT